MAIEVTLEFVTFILSISAVIVGYQTIPKLKTDLVVGWRWIILAIIIFTINQLFIILNNITQDAVITILGLLFISVLNIGFVIHLVKIESKTITR